MRLRVQVQPFNHYVSGLASNLHARPLCSRLVLLAPIPSFLDLDWDVKAIAFSPLGQKRER
jgi:hypothetical protein